MHAVPQFPVPERVARTTAWAGVVLIACLLVWAWTSGKTDAALALLVFLVCTVALQVFLTDLPGFLKLQVVVVALVNGAGGAFDWFERIGWYDEAVHVYSGFAGMAAIGFLYARDRRPRRGALVLWCTAVGLALAVGWEVIEGWVGDLEAVDTLTDIALGTAGAAVAGRYASGLLGAGRAREG